MNQANVEPPRGDPAKAVAIGVVLLIAGLAVLYALMDRKVPSTSGGIVSAYVVQVAPRVSGTVTRVHVADDSVVEAGEALFSIDPRPFELAVSQAEADLQNALQTIDASSASLVAAQAGVTQARTALDNTRSEADRTLKLEERGIAAVAQGDRARAAVAEAEAQLDRAQANLASAKAQLGSDGADNPVILAAASRLEQAQYDLASTTVSAPHRGFVTGVTLSEGQFIGAGAPAMTFINSKAGWITIDLRENQLQRVEAGDPARLLFDGLPGRIFDGHVQSVSAGIDPGRARQGGLVVNRPDGRWFEPARRIPVRVELEGGMDEWPYTVRLGGKVHVVILADGGGPLAWLAGGLQRLRSWTSFLY